ncbi:MAG TPA: hypothetical protein VHF22_11225 [Planctomycetota bacterium]|nr:hypothetical protein [Planctomycetota bacterium]
MIATAAEQVKVPLKIRFLDPVTSLKVGREVRIEVTRADGAGERVPIDHLDFSFSPLVWGEVRPGPETGLAVVRVVATAKPVDIYDRPKYGLTATFKARGDAALEHVNRFVLGMAAPVVELRFFIREDDLLEGFNPQEQRTPLTLADFEVAPPGSAEVIVDGDRIAARILWANVVPKLTVKFPNGERAAIDLDLTKAGAKTVVAPEEAPAEPAPATSPALATAPSAASAPAKPAAGPVLTPPPQPAIDPSASLRREVQAVRRDVDTALAAGGPLPPSTRERLLKKIDSLRGFVLAYKGPDAASLREFFQRTLGEVALGA